MIDWAKVHREALEEYERLMGSICDLAVGIALQTCQETNTATE